MKQPKSYQLGAAHERQAVIAHLQSMRRGFSMNDDPRDYSADSEAIGVISGLIDWIEGRKARYDAIEGGLQGRKAKGK